MSSPSWVVLVVLEVLTATARPANVDAVSLYMGVLAASRSGEPGLVGGTASDASAGCQRGKQHNNLIRAVQISSASTGAMYQGKPRSDQSRIVRVGSWV